MRFSIRTRKIIVLLAVCCLAAITGGCQRAEAPLDVDIAQTVDRSPDDEPAPPTNSYSLESHEVRAALAADGDFAFALYRALAKENKDGNVVCAPFSISTALTIAAEGASRETAEQMGAALQFPDDVKRDGADAKLRPWDMAAMHAGQAALASRFANRTSPELRQRVAKLRRELHDANQQIEQSSGAQDGQRRQDDIDEAAGKAREAARKLNQLLPQVDPYEFEAANALWVDQSYPLRAEFLHAIQTHYGRNLAFPLNFRSGAEASRAEINRWTKTRTAERIDNLLSAGAVSERTRMVITNAVYFRGEWLAPFKPSSTQNKPFHLPGGHDATVEMMHEYHHWACSYAAFNADGAGFDTPREIPVAMSDTDPSLYPADDGFTMLSVPYKGNVLEMIWLVPQSPAGLAAIESKLTFSAWKRYAMRLDRRAVQVNVPKFKLALDYELAPTLSELGMQRAFIEPVENGGAQFDGLCSDDSQQNRLFVSAVLHKSFVEVNEKGTEAAAATAVVTSVKSVDTGFGHGDKVQLRPFIPIFTADKPFFFAIRDRAAGALLFVGRVMQPK